MNFYTQEKQLKSHIINLKSYLKHIDYEIRNYIDLIYSDDQFIQKYQNQLLEINHKIDKFEKIKIIVYTSEYQKFIQNEINNLKIEKNKKLYIKYKFFDKINKNKYLLDKKASSYNMMLNEYNDLKNELKNEIFMNKRRRLK